MPRHEEASKPIARTQGRERLLAAFLLAVVVGGCEQLAQSLGTGTNASSSAADAGATDSGADASVLGAGCGTESNTGTELCVATSLCPNIVVDTQSMPNCGFRIRGATVDLVCGCGTSICPMGVFATCDEATQLLSQQTQQSACVQVAEGRCTESAAKTSSTSTSSSASSSNGGVGCDRQCVKDCGGGAACASLCNCD